MRDWGECLEMISFAKRCCIEFSQLLRESGIRFSRTYDHVIDGMNDTVTAFKIGCHDFHPIDVQISVGGYSERFAPNGALGPRVDFGRMILAERYVLCDHPTQFVLVLEKRRQLRT